MIDRSRADLFGCLGHLAWRMAILGLGFYCFAVGAYAAPSASAEGSKDVVVFVNGDRLSGKLSQASQESVAFVADVTKLVTLEWKDIQEIDVGDRTLLVIGRSEDQSTSSNSFSLDQAVLKVQGSDLVFSSGAAQVRRMPIDQLLSAAPKATSHGKSESVKPALLNGWGGQLQSQDSLTASTQRQYQVGSSIHLARTTESDAAFEHEITSLNLLANYGESKKPAASPVITQVYEANLQHDIYVTDNYDQFDRRRWGGARVFAVTDFYNSFPLVDVLLVWPLRLQV